MVRVRGQGEGLGLGVRVRGKGAPCAHVESKASTGTAASRRKQTFSLYGVVVMRALGKG